MNLAVSNFAWTYDESKDIFEFFNKLGIKNIELVLTKYKSWELLDDFEILKYKNELDGFGVSPYAIQSLFYNIDCTIKDTKIIINHLEKLIQFSKLLDVKILVFGSPSLRKKVDNFNYYLSKMFKDIDDLLYDKKINLLIEPNTKLYGGEYFNTIPEIVKFIKDNNLENIKTMIDTHNILLEDMNPIIDIEENFNYIHHIHISEPNLSCIEDTNFHINFSRKIKEIKYDKMITYEVNKCDFLKKSIELFCDIYK